MDEIQELIMKMEECGWREAEPGVIQSPLGFTFGSWMDAIKACIEVASEA